MDSPATLADLRERFASQRAAVAAEPAVAASVRIDRLDRAIDLLITHQQALCEALASDFGQRSGELSRFMDLFPAVHGLKFARKRVRRWMRPRRIRLGLPLGVPGVRGEVRPQPLGVVGIVCPWNFPIALSFGPLAGVLAAGNRCLIKPSEFAPSVAALLRELVAKAFDSAELAVIVGGEELARAFVSLPFDHLLFTGSTALGRRVMASAAEHLVPVTLELGGKCPAIIGRSADLERAVDRLMLAKLANAGQMCLAPDYVWVAREAQAAFVAHVQRWTQRHYPGIPANDDYTSIINERHVARLAALVEDARAQGAEVIPLGSSPEQPQRSRCVSPALILGVGATMRVMQEEIFGPLIPVLAYERIDQALDEVSRGERPLALYYFGEDRAEEALVIARTSSGAVTVNDVATHFLAEELPFGGIGASGMGVYHGEHGFRRFSHERAILHQGRLDIAGLVGLRPPYAPRLRRSLALLLRR